MLGLEKLRKKKVPIAALKPFCPMIGGRCVKGSCALYFEYERHYFDLDEQGNRIQVDGKDKVRTVQEGKCAFTCIPQEILAARELAQNALRMGMISKER